MHKYQPCRDGRHGVFAYHPRLAHKQRRAQRCDAQREDDGDARQHRVHIERPPPERRAPQHGAHEEDGVGHTQGGERRPREAPCEPHRGDEKGDGCDDHGHEKGGTLVAVDAEPQGVEASGRLLCRHEVRRAAGQQVRVAGKHVDAAHGDVRDERLGGRESEWEAGVHTGVSIAECVK